MPPLLLSLAALALGALLIRLGMRWMRRGGRYQNAEGVSGSNFVRGLATGCAGIISLGTGGLMATEVQPRLYGVGLAVVAVLVGVVASWRAISLSSADAVLDDVRRRIRRGDSPSAIDVACVSAAHRVIRDALAVERPPERAQIGYRSAERSQQPAYVESVATAITRTRRGVSRRFALAVSVGGLPLAATAYYAVAPTPLEPLGWQVLGGACCLSLACGVAWLRVRAHTQRVGSEMRSVLGAPVELPASPE